MRSPLGKGWRFFNANPMQHAYARSAVKSTCCAGPEYGQFDIIHRAGQTQQYSLHPLPFAGDAKTLVGQSTVAGLQAINELFLGSRGYTIWQSLGSAASQEVPLTPFPFPFHPSTSISVNSVNHRLLRYGAADSPLMDTYLVHLDAARPMEIRSPGR